MKTDEWFEQKDEVVELRPEENLVGVRDISLVRTDQGFKIRISVGDYMYFDSPVVHRPEAAKAILDNIKRRLQ